MSNFFKKIGGGVENMQKDFLGETYQYHKNINSPSELGMSGKGDLGVLAKNVAGLVNYTEVLITGEGRASKTGRPLGNKFFLKTAGKCEPRGYINSRGKLVENKKGGNSTSRYIYINNQPDGSVPFISSGMGRNFGNFRGLIPGVVGNLGHINPLEIMGGFAEKGNPPCYKVNLPTIDAKNRRGRASQYVAKSDLANLSGCAFRGGYNPVSKKTTRGCKEGFDIMQKYLNKERENVSDPTKMAKDPVVVMYTTSFALLMSYLLYRLMRKN